MLAIILFFFNNMKKFYYIYKTTNLVNGKQYIGDHSTYNLNDKYLGSGKLLHNSIKKYGKQNFNKEILEYFNTKEEAFNAQEKYIQQYNTLKPNGYNISPKGGYGVPRSYLSEETKLKISNSLKGKTFSEERKQNISNAHKGKTIFIKNFGPRKFGKDNPAYVEVDKVIIDKIIYLHLNNHLSAKAIKKELNLSFSWVKVLKILRENNCYNPNYYSIEQSTIDNIINLRINEHLSAKNIKLKLNLSLNENKILNIIKENNVFEKIYKYKYKWTSF
jgi:hypothetical protein